MGGGSYNFSVIGAQLQELIEPPGGQSGGLYPVTGRFPSVCSGAQLLLSVSWPLFAEHWRVRLCAHICESVYVCTCMLRVCMCMCKCQSMCISEWVHMCLCVGLWHVCAHVCMHEGGTQVGLEDHKSPTVSEHLLCSGSGSLLSCTI